MKKEKTTKTSWRDDEKEQHPFYSDFGVKRWEKRKRELVKEEQAARKEKPYPNEKDLQEQTNTKIEKFTD